VIGKKPTLTPIFWQVIACLPPDILRLFSWYRKAADMFTPTNPEQERIRALNALSALTEYDKAVALLAPNARHDDGCEQVEASRRPYASAYGSRRRSVVRALKAIPAELLAMLRM